jgi:nitrogen-specific signal transduction histidine kinase
VADTGPGIPEEEQPHVWEELYRGEAGRGVPGSGLGLALVRAVADHKKIVGMDVVELLPQPGDHASDFLAAKLIYKTLGYIFCQE